MRCSQRDSQTVPVSCKHASEQCSSWRYLTYALTLSRRADLSRVAPSANAGAPGSQRHTRGARLPGWRALEVNLLVRGTGYNVKTENNNFGSKEPRSQLTK